MKFVLDCINAVYDAEEGFISIFGTIRGTDEKKIIYFSKDDFTFNNCDDPDFEMKKTAAMMIGKPIEWDIRDDPNRQIINEEDQAERFKQFCARIQQEIDNTSTRLVDESAQIQRKLGRMSKEGKINHQRLDAIALLQEEERVRRQTGEE